jgi:DNA modification methylase
MASSSRISNKAPSSEPSRTLAVTYHLASDLKPCERNARTHSRKQIRQIAESIKTFGFTNPVLLDGDSGIIAGHGRVEAAKLLGITEVPTIRLNTMTDAQRRAYIIADNKLAENAGWDRALLALELQYITKLDADFDLTVTGLEVGEIDVLIDASHSADPSADLVPEVADGPVVSRQGDLWQLGPHRLACGDARDPSAYAQLMDGKRAQMVFTDPPYNVPIDGHACGLGRIKHSDFVMAAGEMTEPEFTAFLNTAMNRLAEHSVDGSIHFICMDWRHSPELLAAARGIYAELKNICVWNKDNGGMGTFYRSKHEFVFVYKKGTAPHINNFELGQHGRYRTNVWDFPGVNSTRSGRLDDLKMHPTVKPVTLVAEAIKDCSKRKGIILDPFAGSGTTLIAAEQAGRRAHALELDPKYVDTAVRRWQEYTGEHAIHSESGQTFTETERLRAAGLTC